MPNIDNDSPQQQLKDLRTQFWDKREAAQAAARRRYREEDEYARFLARAETYRIAAEMSAEEQKEHEEKAQDLLRAIEALSGNLE